MTGFLTIEAIQPNGGVPRRNRVDVLPVGFLDHRHRAAVLKEGTPETGCLFFLPYEVQRRPLPRSPRPKRGSRISSRTC